MLRQTRETEWSTQVQHLFESLLACFNPSESKGNYSATSNNTKLVHWPLMGGLLHLVQRGGDWAGCGRGGCLFLELCTKFGSNITRTVVRECCKGDDASQWRSPKFDPPSRSNPVRGNHKNWQRWLRRGPLHLCKSLSRFAQAFPFRACVTLRAKLHIQKVLVFFFFGGGFLQLATAKAPGRILTQNTPKLAVLRKDVPLRGREHKI